MTQRLQIVRGALALGVVIFAHRAAAQSLAPAGSEASRPPAQAAPVVVDVDATAQSLPEDSIRDAIAHELGAPVIAPGEPTAQPPRGTLRIMMDDQRRIVLIFRDAAGREVWRTVTRPDDPAAALATIAFLAGNLAREEADELIVQAPPPSPPAPPAPAPVESVAPVTTIAPVPVVVLPPDRAALAQQAITVTLPTPDRHGGRLALYLSPTVAFSNEAVGFSFTSGAAVRFAHRWWVDLEGGYGSISGSGFNDYSSFRWWLIPKLVVRVPVGPVAFEFGLGVGVTGNSASELGSLGCSPSSCAPIQENYTAPAVQSRVGFVWAVNAHWDLFARFQVAVDTGSYWGISDHWWGELALGVQARFL